MTQGAAANKNNNNNNITQERERNRGLHRGGAARCSMDLRWSGLVCAGEGGAKPREREEGGRVSWGWGFGFS